MICSLNPILRRSDLLRSPLCFMKSKTPRDSYPMFGSPSPSCSIRLPKVTSRPRWPSRDSSKRRRNSLLTRPRAFRRTRWRRESEFYTSGRTWLISLLSSPFPRFSHPFWKVRCAVRSFLRGAPRFLRISLLPHFSILLSLR